MGMELAVKALWSVGVTKAVYSGTVFFSSLASPVFDYGVLISIAKGSLDKLQLTACRSFLRQHPIAAIKELAGCQPNQDVNCNPLCSGFLLCIKALII